MVNMVAIKYNNFHKGDDEKEDGINDGTAFSLATSPLVGSWCHHKQSPLPATFAEYT